MFNTGCNTRAVTRAVRTHRTCTAPTRVDTARVDTARCVIARVDTARC